MNLSRPFLPHFKEWPCSRCTLINSRTKYFCTACGTAYTKPPKPEKEKKRKEDTTRSEFGLDELSSKSSRPRRPSPPNRLESSGTWKCTVCTLQNKGRNKFCGACQSPKPVQSNSNVEREEDDLMTAVDVGEWVCPEDDCGSTFKELWLYDEHMALHMKRKRKEVAPDYDYVTQYKRYIEQMHKRGRMSSSMAASEIKEMEKNLLKADDNTRTKGIVSIIASSYTGKKRETILCKSVDHFFCGYGDAGWGCGYRNLQMICSYLYQYPQFKKAMFDGCGFIPSIPVIQEWVEKSWEDGFPGAEYFKGKLASTKGKMGTNDVAALFRFFGVKMDVLDFTSPKLPEAVIQAQEEESRYTGKKPLLYEPSVDLLEWVWNYFSNPPMGKKFVPPLYLQHPGHSRTIVGAERGKKTGKIYLLIFDPAHIGPRLKNALKVDISEDAIHNLRLPAKYFSHGRYQVGAITSVDILKGDDREKLKTMDFLLDNEI